jgi:hypothetical protein
MAFRRQPCPRIPAVVTRRRVADARGRGSRAGPSCRRNFVRGPSNDGWQPSLRDSRDGAAAACRRLLDKIHETVKLDRAAGALAPAGPTLDVRVLLFVSPTMRLRWFFLSVVLLFSSFDAASAGFPFDVGSPRPVGDFSLGTVPLDLDDRQPVTVEGGPGFLLAWGSWMGPWPGAGSYVMLFDTAGKPLRSAPTGLPLDPGLAAAWNGEEFLLASALRQSRFNTRESDHIGLLRLSADGTPVGGVTKLGRSLCNYVDVQSVLWSTNHWLVTWRACNESFIAALDRSLRPRFGIDSRWSGALQRSRRTRNAATSSVSNDHV